MKSIAYISSSPNSIIWFLKNEIISLSNYTKIYIFSNKSTAIKLLCKKNHNIEYIELNFSRRMSFIMDFISVHKVIKIIKKNNIKVIKSITLKGGFVGIIAGILSKTKIRYHVVAGIPWLRKNLVIKFFSYIFEIPVMLLSTHIQTDSFEQKNILNKIYGIQKKIIVLNKGSLCGVPDIKIESKFIKIYRARMRKLFSIKNDDKIMIYVGRICKDKGINELVDAFNHLNTKKINSSYYLILLGLIEEKHDKISNKTQISINNNK